MAEEHPLARRRRSLLPPHGNNDGIDHISGLPDDILLLVLARLGHHRDAVRTSILSHRWPVLTKGSTIDRSIYEIEFQSVPSAIRALGSFVSLIMAQRPDFMGLGVLEVRAPAGIDVDVDDVSEALFAASEISPLGEFRFILPCNVGPNPDDRASLPGFDLIISIDLNVRYLCLNLAGQFPVLERLTLTGCYVEDMYSLVKSCPHLRVLKITSFDASIITIHSETLQELQIQNATYQTDILDILAPSLKYLILSIKTAEKHTLSIIVPMVEEIAWECKYQGMCAGIGELWRLTRLSLKTREEDVINSLDGKSLSLHVFPRNAQSPMYAIANAPMYTFEQEILNLPIAGLCTLEMHIDLRETGHAWSSLVLHILRVDSICTATKRLKIVLLKSEVEGACAADCPCHDPTQITTLVNLQEIEIRGFGGDDYEFEFLKVLSRAAPMLVKITTFSCSAGN